MIRRNGKPGDAGLKTDIPDSAASLDSIRDVLREEHGMKHVSGCKFFGQDGNEVTDGTMVLLRDGDVLYLEPLADRPFDYGNILEQYTILEQLGQGGFGQVHKAQYKLTHKVVAIKYMDITEYSTDAEFMHIVYHASKIDEIYREAQALQKLSHPNIVQLYHAFLLKQNVVLIMEYVPGGELYKFVKERDGLTESQSRRFFVQLTDAVEYCHNKYVIHRDLKPTNILLSDPVALTVKVIIIPIEAVIR